MITMIDGDDIQIVRYKTPKQREAVHRKCLKRGASLGMVQGIRPFSHPNDVPPGINVYILKRDEFLNQVFFGLSVRECEFTGTHLSGYLDIASRRFFERCRVHYDYRKPLGEHTIDLRCGSNFASIWREIP